MKNIGFIIRERSGAQKRSEIEKKIMLLIWQMQVPACSPPLLVGQDFIYLQDQPCRCSEPLLPDGQCVCGALGSYESEMCQPQVDPWGCTLISSFVLSRIFPILKCWLVHWSSANLFPIFASLPHFRSDSCPTNSLWLPEFLST